MCGIVAYYGKNPIKNILNGIKNVSYRGYDSWGFVLSDGRLYHSTLKDIDSSLEDNYKGFAIGHTRWATHGKDLELNCQPFNIDNDFILCHNGIITNIDELYPTRNKENSDTRSLFLLISRYMALNPKYCYLAYISEILFKCEGDNVFLFFYNNKLYSIITGNKDLYQQENIVSSDMSNINPKLPYRIYNKEDGLVCYEDIKNYRYTIPVAKNKTKDFMLSEIFEQNKLKFTNEFQYLSRCKIIAYGCGSSYNACKVLEAKYPNIRAIHSCNIKHIDTDVCSEDFIAFSQSGETKDTIDAYNYLYEKIKRFPENRMFVVTNNINSTLGRKQNVINLNCGPEYGVAATKTFTAMTNIFDVHEHHLCMIGSSFTEMSEKIKMFVGEKTFKNYIILSDYKNYGFALEAALKLKEVANVWTDVMYSSEVKHGPISCVSKDTLVIRFGEHTEESNNNINQVISRGAMIFPDDFSNIYGCQFLAYWTAKKLGLDPDKPVNIAKCVTV